MNKAAVAALFVLCPTIALGQTPQLVDVGGYRLEVAQSGSGAPAIVLVAGLGDGLDSWTKIFPGTSKLSATISYSRAGFGHSDPGPSDHSARQEVMELHTLLSRLRLPPPYVLVGHSYGGILVRLYTSLFPSEVAGLVLVDATHEQQVQRWGAIDSSYLSAFRDFVRGRLDTLGAVPEAAELRESARIQAAGTVEGLAPLPDIPIAVLTSMKIDPAAKFVNQTARGYAAWRAMHDEWFLRSSNGLHITTTRSGHHIQDDEPQLVIDAIRFVLERVKAH